MEIVIEQREYNEFRVPLPSTLKKSKEKKTYSHMLIREIKPFEDQSDIQGETFDPR